MSYSEDRAEQQEILEDYDLRKFEYTGSRDGRKSLRTSVMFLERYNDLLKPGAELITIMDDSVLSGKSRKFARNWIRQNYIIKAVISLPGDAFQRVGARQKTSVLYLKKKESPDEEQPAVFMDECVAMGLEDKPQRTPESERKEAKEATQQEIESMIDKFRRFENGEEGPWLVESDKVTGRLDVKYCRPHSNPAQKIWEEKGIPMKELGEIVELVDESVKPEESPNEEFTFLEISYKGDARKGKEKIGRDINYSSVNTAQPGDIIISHINAVHGSICVLPEKLGSVIVSKEYSILRVDEEEIDPQYLKLLLRSPEFRAMMLSVTTGGGRHRVEWGSIKGLSIPILDIEKQKEVTDKIREADRIRKKADQIEENAIDDMEDKLGLTNEQADHRLKAAEPPQ